MKRIAILAVACLATACDRAATSGEEASAGAALEHAAQAQGLVIDAASVSLVGAWGRETDRVCIVPGKGRAYRIGALVDYGAGQSCAASGTATRSKDRVDIAFGDCRIAAKLVGDRLVFPATVPDACAAYCQGRGSFEAVTVDHLGTSLSEASTLRGPDGAALCGS